MARLRLLADDEMDPEVRSWLDGSDGDTEIRMFAHAPDFLKSFTAFMTPLRTGGRLEPELKELVRLKLAELNDCSY